MQHNTQGCDHPLCKNILFIRHGETDWSRSDILNGEKDLPLNKNGCQQAEQTALFLKSYLSNARHPIMVTSPLKRAAETADIIARITGIAVSAVKPDLREFYDYQKVNDSLPLPPGAETVDIFQRRVSSVQDELLSDFHQADPLIIVSHQNVFKHLAKHIAKQQAALSMAGVAYFKRDTDDRWRLEVVNIKDKMQSLAPLLMKDIFANHPSTPGEMLVDEPLTSLTS